MTQQSQSLLTARDVHFAYPNGVRAIDGVDLDVAPGKLLCLLGENGSGKTTLLGLLMGKLVPGAGAVTLEARSVHRYRAVQRARRIAYVPQFPEVSFSYSVRHLVLMGRYAWGGSLGLAGSSDLDIAHAAMERTDTLAFADRLFGQLSGGQAQRVMIARALAQRPAILLADEPTSHLDLRHQLQIYSLMADLAHNEGMAVVCVSHDMNLAGRFADALVLMKDGRIVCSGTPQDTLQPDIIRQVYGVNVNRIDPYGAGPIIYPQP